jgi:putative transposase
MRLKELALARPRYGYRRLHILLRREGWMVNPKRVLRLYREEGLTLRIPRRKRKYTSWVRVPLPAPTRRNEHWVLDFVTDALVNSRRFRVLTVLDVFARECLALEAATHFPASRMTLVLDRIVAQRSQPGVMTLDNGPEFAGRHFDAWAYRRGIRLDSSVPGARSRTPSSSRSTAGCAMSASTPTGGRTLTKPGETWRIGGATVGSTDESNSR